MYQVEDIRSSSNDVPYAVKSKMPQTRFETHNSLHIAFLVLLVIMYSLFRDQKLIVKSPKRKKKLQT